MQTTPTPRTHAAERRTSSGSSSALELAARVGYLAKGAVYALIGALAFQAAFAGRSGAEGGRGALRTLADEPLGQIALGLIGVGLLAYALWRVYAAASDAEAHGSDASGIGARVGMVVTGLLHGSLGVYALSLLIGEAQRGGGPAPGGDRFALIAGLAVAGYGLVELYRAYADRYVENWRTSEMSAGERTWAARAAKLGLSARGIVFLTLGTLLVVTGAGGSAGIETALDTLSRQAYGSWLLAAVAVGLVAYGIYCAFDARYRTVRA